MARARILKLDNVDGEPGDQPSTPRRRPPYPSHADSAFSSSESIKRLAREARRKNTRASDDSDDDDDSDSDDDDDSGIDDKNALIASQIKQKTAAQLAEQPRGSAEGKPKVLSKVAAMPRIVNSSVKPDSAKHPRWAAINEKIQRAPGPLRFVGGTVGFVGNTAFTVGSLPVELIARGIRGRRDAPTNTEAAIQAQMLAWDEVDPAFPQHYSTTFLGTDELNAQQARQVHQVVTDQNIPKIFPYPRAVGRHEPTMTELRDKFIALGAAGLFAFFFTWYILALDTITGRGIRPLEFVSRSSFMGIMAAFFLLSIAVVRRHMLKEIESHRNALFTARAKKYSPPMPESVEWINASIRAVWQQIDPKLFVPLADQVEDVMQASLPKLVNAVKVDDLGIGINPFQLTSLRALRRSKSSDEKEDGKANTTTAQPGTKPSEGPQGTPQRDGSSAAKNQRESSSSSGPLLASQPAAAHPPDSTSDPTSNPDSDRTDAGEKNEASPPPNASPGKAGERLPNSFENPRNDEDNVSELIEGPVNRANKIELATPLSREHSLHSEDLNFELDNSHLTKPETIRHKLRARALHKIIPGKNDSKTPSSAFSGVDGGPSGNTAHTNPQQRPAATPNTAGDDENALTMEESNLEKQIKVQDQAGDFIHLEAAFSYCAPPHSPRADNIHMMIQFFVGAMDIFQFPFPVWVQIEKLSGTIRLRAQLVSEPPYIRNVTFALMGVPRIEVSVTPMIQSMGNILDIPLISSFVQSSIAAAANEYVAPQSMSLNVMDILSGGGVKKETDALGILAVHIDYARDLSSQDPNGYSDPYIVIMLEKLGQWLYRTRIVRRDLNPVWNEYAFILITANDVKNDEQLSIQLWDWDRHSPDDIIGRISRSVRQIMRHPNVWHRHTQGLRGFEAGTEMQGQLTYEVGFFEKGPFGPRVVQPAEGDDSDKLFEGQHGLDSVTEHLRKQEDAALKERVRMQARYQEMPDDTEELRRIKRDWQRLRDERARRTALSLQATGSMHLPPNPDYPTGVLSILIESIAGLENRDVEKGYKGRAREGGAGQDIDNQQASKRIPSSYVEMILNEQVMYRTRTKQYTNEPFFNAGIELMVRDWRTANVTICVRDARLREHDPVMGIVWYVYAFLPPARTRPQLHSRKWIACRTRRLELLSLFVFFFWPSD